MRIVSSEGEEVGEGHVGEIEIQSYGLMRGYMDVDAQTTFRSGGWLPTGDLGYLSDGEVFVTGRLKDVLIVMGANYAPEDIEWAAARVDRVRKGRCIAFGNPDADGEIIVVLEARDEARYPWPLIRGRPGGLHFGRGFAQRGPGFAERRDSQDHEREAETLDDASGLRTGRASNHLISSTA